MARLFAGIVLGFLLLPIVVLGWFQLGHPPVAVADPPLPEEKFLTSIPLNARIDRELVKKPPIEASEANFIAGAHVYREQCAACHGLHGQPSSFGPHMFPDAPPLWQKHPDHDGIGVSDDPPGETYWKVANGIRLTGMPAYKDVLTETEMWQVSLLLANADKPLPPAVVDLIRQPLPATSATQPTPVEK